MSEAERGIYDFNQYRCIKFVLEFADADCDQVKESFLDILHTLETDLTWDFYDHTAKISMPTTFEAWKIRQLSYQRRA